MTLVENLPWAPGDQSEGPSVLIVTPPGALPEGARVAVAESSASSVTVDVVEGIVVVRVPAGEARRGITVTVPAADAVAIWRPGSGQERGRLAPSWADLEQAGPFTGAWLGALLGRCDQVLLGFGAVAGDSVIRARAGMVEETADLVVQVFVDDPTDEIALVLDVSKGSLTDVAARLGAALGLRRSPVAERDENPVYCSWYAFHQDLSSDALVAEAQHAARLGFGTVIVDDGWQNSDVTRGYGSCGDWRVHPSKFRDGRELVSRIADAGLRTMWWVGTPFIGYRSDIYSHGDLPLLYDEPAMETAILDPRSPRSRQYLVDRLTALLKDTGADGLKIDFLERFAAPGGALPEDADIEEPSRAALVLLDEVRSAADGELMIEFREPYLSAATITRATMMRVADCPLGPVQNRLGIIDMRLLTRGIAVHSDPIMWSTTDSSERVAQQLLSAIFGVPQVSVLLSGLSKSHENVLAHWLGFWREHRELLLHAPLHAEGADRGFPLVHARRDDVAISVRYADVAATVPDGPWRVWHLVNADEDAAIVRGGRGRFDVSVRDAAGREVEHSTGLDLTLASIPIPAGGRAAITRSDV